jgi:hypothetical protein
MLALLRSNQLASVADHGFELPTTTLITSAYVRVWDMQSFNYILDSHATAASALVESKSFWQILRVKP